LASLGYQVFEPNFRGSSGFGKAFADKGRRQWGKVMQTDIDDAHDHLIAAGLVREGQACIMGYSYGGYAALAAATLTPDRYACVIAGAAPTDLLKMLSWDRKEEGHDSEAYLYWVEHIGHPSTDKDELESLSPANLAARVTRPILLVHGEDDSIVPIEQSEFMEKALRKAGKGYEFVRLPDSAHSYRSDADERTEYEAIRRFLTTHLPPDPPR
jgi:dipeptidyl aminopeptidase/acylaminoacyl peptidase